MKGNSLYKVISFNYLTSLRQIPQEVDYTRLYDNRVYVKHVKYIYCVNIHSYIVL